MTATAATLKRIYAFLAFFPFSLGFSPLYGILSRPAVYQVLPPPPASYSVISGHGWGYTVPFEVKNAADIEKLIQCESQGVNISRPDSNRRMSDGVLQFNRSPSDVLGSGTWSDMERRFNYHGSPVVPADAIHLADLMISNGFLERWTCSKILKLH